jgi:hypothetical protein
VHDSGMRVQVVYAAREPGRPVKHANEKNSPKAVRLTEPATLTLGLSSGTVSEGAAMEKAHVKGVTTAAVKNAEGETISPQKMSADRKMEGANGARPRDDVQGGVRLPARSAKHEPPSRF